MHITFDQPDTRLPADLSGKPKSMKWHEYCLRLSRKCSEVNGRDAGELKLTIHVNRREYTGLMQEMAGWESGTALAQATRVADLTLAGCRFKCDSPEFV